MRQNLFSVQTHIVSVHLTSCDPLAPVALALAAGSSSYACVPPEQSCLDVARAYADARIMELIRTKVDSLPKPRDPKKGKRREVQTKPRAPPTLKEKVSWGDARVMLG